LGTLRFVILTAVAGIEVTGEGDVVRVVVGVVDHTLMAPDGQDTVAKPGAEVEDRDRLDTKVYMPITWLSFLNTTTNVKPASARSRTVPSIMIGRVDDWFASIPEFG
jgi:hypothetical protein